MTSRFPDIAAVRILPPAYVIVALLALGVLGWKECMGLGLLILVLVLVLDRTFAAVAAGAAVVAAGTAAVAARTDGLAVAWFGGVMRVATVAVLVVQVCTIAALAWKCRPRRGSLLTGGATCVAVGLLVGMMGAVLGRWSSLATAYPLVSCGLFLMAASSCRAPRPARSLLVVVAAIPVLLGAGKLVAGRIVAARDPTGTWDDLVAHYQRAVWLDPTGLAPRRELAYNLATGGRVAAALAVLESAVGLDGVEAASARMRAVTEAEVGLWSHAVFSMVPDASFGGGEWDELGALLAAEVESRRSASRAHLNLAWYLRLSDRQEEAAEVLREALLAGPQLRGLHYNLGLLLEDMRLKSLARMEFEAELVVFQDSPDAWLQAATDTAYSQQADTLLDIESMRATVGKPAERGWGLYGEGELEGGFFLGEGGWRALGFVAQGSRADGVWPIMSVWLDQAEAGRWVVCGNAWTTYWLVGAFAPGAHSLRVRFENDYSTPDGSEDRNLWVDFVAIVPPKDSTSPEDLLARLGLERVRILGGPAALAG